MKKPLLEIQDLHVSVEDREILHGVDLVIPEGETHILFGPNGSGKTTLLNTIMGLSGYRVTQGRILFDGQDITHLPPYERARLGIGMAFQRPPTLHGVRLRDMVRLAAGNGDNLDIEGLARRLNLTEHLDRDVNAGFSGGEIKRSELLQLKAQSPRLVMLDEPESGVDLENIQLIGQIIAELLQKTTHHHYERRVSGLIITHTGFILDYIEADRGHVLCNGVLQCSGNPREILQNIRQHGYEECVTCRVLQRI